MAKYVVMNGNMAAAMGAKFCRPDVIAAYPITPQTPIVEYLAQFIAEGELDAAFSEVESEHSAMSVIQGAALAGGRTFTATSSQGLALMYEPYFRTSTLRLPVVMAIVNREMISPQTVWGGPQDSLTLRDAGWIQLYCEDNQEILDTIIQAYKIAENSEVLLPVNVCFDGFYLSHMAEKVEVPDQELVDEFLPPYYNCHIKLDPQEPISVDPLTPGSLLIEYRQKHMEAMQRAVEVIKSVDIEFGKVFGRCYGGLVADYRLEDADYVIVTLGSMTGAAKEAVDLARDKGIAVGVLRVRALRPFPVDEIRKKLMGRRAVAVVDRNVSFGWGTGILYQEICSALYGISSTPIPILPYIGGLGGEDLTIDMFNKVIDDLKKAGPYSENITTRWLIRGESK